MLTVQAVPSHIYRHHDLEYEAQVDQALSALVPEGLERRRSSVVYRIDGLYALIEAFAQMDTTMTG